MFCTSSIEASFFKGQLFQTSFPSSSSANEFCLNPFYTHAHVLKKISTNGFNLHRKSSLLTRSSLLETSDGNDFKRNLSVPVDTQWSDLSHGIITSNPSKSLQPFSVEDDDLDKSYEWRLDGEIERLQSLLYQLSTVSSDEEKDLIISSDKLVMSVFGSSISENGLAPGPCRYVKPIVYTALSQFNSQQVYLLKCLVASGQERLLDIPVDWQSNYNENSFDQSFSSEQLSPGGNAVKDALMVIAQMIENWDASDPKAMISELIQSFDTPSFLPNLPSSSGQAKFANSPSGSIWDMIASLPSQAMELVNDENEYKNSTSSPSPSSSDSLNSMDAIGYSNKGINKQINELLQMLARLEKFYDSIGGILGYQLTALELIKASEMKQSQTESNQVNSKDSNSSISDEKVSFHMPVGPDLASDSEFASLSAVWGINGLPLMGEIYPLGGAGDRLGLVDEATGECLPVAMLPYCGRTLLEGLIRDLQAREYLYYRIYGKQMITPIAIMTSAAKKNHARVVALCKKHNWFGRGQQNFKIFEQPLVPTIAANNGEWLSSSPLNAVLKPGGHGILWKLAYENGVFDWFEKKGRESAIVRQISNPLAGTDVTLLSLSGIGIHENKKFGFASCDRNVGTAEGVNVVLERRLKNGLWEYCVTCVEYTEFKKLGIADTPVSCDSTRSKYPANTNVLYVNLDAIKSIASQNRKCSIPGLIMNLSKPVQYVDHFGSSKSVKAGRLECTMQNVADSLSQTFHHSLPCSSHDKLDTFVVFNDRRKVTSSAKKRRKPDDLCLHQTPDGSFLDLTRNSFEVLKLCNVNAPQISSKEEYLQHGPSFIFLFHPSLGPLWDIIAQKIHGGSISPRSEVQLEIAEIEWKNVHVNGSLLIFAKNVMGEANRGGEEEEDNDNNSILNYGTRCGRCRLQNVSVCNEGIDWSAQTNVFWQNRIQRKQCVHVILHGNAELEAKDVTISGSHVFDVPDGHRMIISPSSNKEGFSCRVEKLRGDEASWKWCYEIFEGKAVLLKMEERR